MKKNIIVVEEGKRLFWFCGSCGRPLAKTKTNELICPRGHVKKELKARMKFYKKTGGQLEFDFK